MPRYVYQVTPNKILTCCAVEMVHKMTLSATWSGEVSSTVQTWLQDCTQGRDIHHRCDQIQTARRSRSDAGANFLPTRLLELRRVNQELKIRLRETQSLKGNERYMTLSHCWGKPGSMDIKLTKNTLTSFRKGIEIHVLPLTFQEAIQVTENLDANLLWIDALCILQDSDEDWLRESSTMANVYSNTYLNIAATAGTDPHCGLFHTKRNLVPEDAIDAYTTWTGDLLPGQYVLYGEDLFKSSVDNGPLNQRAWVVQERALAPRVLHFAANHLFWECGCLAAMDNLPQGLFAGVHIKEHQSVMENWYKLRSNNISPYMYWSKLVNEYSSCHLTKSSDKLIAISALAQSVKTLLKAHGYEDVYLAGLWKDDLENGLLWSTTGASSEGGIRVGPTPSWSWASVHYTRIWYPNDDEEERLLPLAKIIEVSTFPIGTEFGPVSGGILRMQGPLCKLSLAISGDMYESIVNGLMFSEIRHVSQVNLSWDVRADDREPCEDLLFMAIRQNEHEYYKRLEGLLLIRTEKHRGQYTRVGRLNLEFTEDHQFTLDDAEIWSSLELSQEYYMEYHNNGQYTISII